MTREPADPFLVGENSFLFYETEGGRIRIEVRTDGETVWLTLAQIARLFLRNKSVISRHLGNIFEEGELAADAVLADFSMTSPDGRTHRVAHYNLDAIIAVGYRVRSARGMQFRNWATQHLREFLVKGFAMDDLGLREGQQRHYYKELMTRARMVSVERRLAFASTGTRAG